MPCIQTMAIPFKDGERAHYYIEKFSLTKIIRQASENPIIQITQQIRDGKFDSINREEFVKEDTNGHGVYFLDDNVSVRKELEKYFKSKEFEEDCDYCKVVAWRNSTINAFNAIIRKFLFGNKMVVYFIDFPRTLRSRRIRNTRYATRKFPHKHLRKRCLAGTGRGA